MIRNQLYPYIEKYINDYLYGFEKQQMNLALIEGKLELKKINIRPDVVNKIMNEINVPFWLKAGLIHKIYIGCSLMNIIGEIPLEATIEGIDIVLCPSYKWINKYFSIDEFTKKNPIGLDLNDNEDLKNKFDTSVFNKPNLEEIFKDKTVISNLVNSILKGLYDFYNMPNFAVILKINKIRIRIEDDELFNYEGNFVLGIKIESITTKMGFKGAMKKNSVKIENFSIYWEKNPKIIIKNEFLNNSMLSGKLDDEYYNLIKEIDFNSIDDNESNENIKMIIDNFNMTINFGTLKKEEGKGDIFDDQNVTKKCYFQISSNEMVINVYPEFLKAINHFSSFSSSFSVIEKIKQYRPDKKPIYRNYKEKGMDKKINAEKKNIVRNWLHYIIWKHKIQNKKEDLIENPFRAEFNRFYNIYHKKANIFEIMEKMKEKNKEEKEDEKEEEEKKNDENKEKANTNTPETKTPEGNDEIITYEQFISNFPGEKNSNKLQEKYDNYLNEAIKKKYQNFSSIIEILIKGFIINIHPSLERNVDISNNITINTSGIEVKIDVSPEQFNFGFGVFSVDIGPSDTIYGERVILNPTSYRQNLAQKNIPMDSNNMINTPGDDNDIYSFNETLKSKAGLTGLINKYNPNQEEKLKIINDALDNIGDKNNYIYNFPSRYKNENTLYNDKTTLRAKPNNLNKLLYSANLNPRMSYATMMGNTTTELNKPRNSSFAKTIIENFNETDLRLKQKLKKQKNDLNISQAINNYNSNISSQRKYTPLNKLRNSSVSNLSYSISNFKFKSGNKFVFKSLKNNNNNNNNNNSSPLNLIEIYSNSKIGALKLKYIKYNNSFSLDDFSIQLGTIRFHPFPQYIFDMISIFLDYKNDPPEIKKSQIRSTDGGGMDGNKILFKLRQKLLETLSELDNKEKTESIKEYINYLNNEIQKLQKFNEDVDTYPFFELNYLFSFFPKGIKFYFDYENVECVYYNDHHKMLGKFMISPFVINVSISLSKIIANIFGFNIEINNLIESKKLVEKLAEECKNMMNQKKDMVKLIIEPCYEAIKSELINEGAFDDNVLKNQKEKIEFKKVNRKLPLVNKK